MKVNPFLLVIAILSGATANADQPVVPGDESITQVLLSPAGSHIAMVRESDAEDAVFVLDRARKKVVGRVLLPATTSVDQIGWADDQTLVIGTAKESSDTGLPMSAGQLKLMVLSSLATCSWP